MNLEIIDPEWAYGAVGKAAGCLVRFREAKEAERLAAIAHVAATNAVTTAEVALTKANDQLAKLVKDWADHKQGVVDPAFGADEVQSRVEQRVGAFRDGLSTING